MHTDFLGNPIATGDTILYATSVSSSVYLNMAVVEDLIALEPVSPDNPYDLRAKPLPADRKKAYSTPRTFPGTWERDPSAGRYGGRMRRNEAKGYILKVRKVGADKVTTIHAVERVVVITPMVRKNDDV